MNKKRIIGLETYNINLNKLSSLKTKIVLEVQFVWPSTKGYISLTPEERTLKLKKYFQNIYKKFSKEIIGLGQCQPLGELSDRASCSIQSQNIASFLKNKSIDAIFIKNISGLKKKQKKEKNWYAVKAHLVIQIEKQKKGQQGHEERVLLVYEDSEKKAVTKVKRQLSKEEIPSFNIEMGLVRTKLLEITDVVPIFLDEIKKEEVNEVYWKLFYKKIQADTIWQ